MLLPLLLAACHLPPRPAPEAPVVMGWRLAPGMLLSYRCDSSFLVGEDRVERSETWRYLVREVDELGTARLEGELLGLEAELAHGGEPLPGEVLEGAVERERRRLARGVRFTLSLDGSLDALDSPSWADGLCHRLLAVGLPLDAVEVGQEWEDAGLARSLAHVLPAGGELELEGSERLASLEWSRRPDWAPGWRRPVLLATLETRARVEPEDQRLPSLHAEGVVHWDLERGALAHRRLEVQQLPARSAPAEAADLQVELWRLELPGTP